jgi:hypothetical protein
MRVDFMGTESIWLAAQQLLSSSTTGYVSDYMKDIDEQKRVEIKALEEIIHANGQRRRIYIRTVTTLYVDPKLGRGVLSDLAFKVTNISPA